MLITIILTYSFVIIIVFKTIYTLFKKNEAHFLANAKFYFASTLKNYASTFILGYWILLKIWAA